MNYKDFPLEWKTGYKNGMDKCLDIIMDLDVPNSPEIYNLLLKEVRKERAKLTKANTEGDKR